MIFEDKGSTGRANITNNEASGTEGKKRARKAKGDTNLPRIAKEFSGGKKTEGGKCDSGYVFPCLGSTGDLLGAAPHFPSAPVRP